MGLGFVPWRMTEKGAGSDAIRVDGDHFEKFSVSLHIGMGCEVQLNNRFALYGEGSYHFMFSEHKFSFIKGFTNQGIFQIGGGLMLYLGQSHF